MSRHHSITPLADWASVDTDCLELTTADIESIFPFTIPLSGNGIGHLNMSVLSSDTAAPWSPAKEWSFVGGSAVENATIVAAQASGQPSGNSMVPAAAVGTDAEAGSGSSASGSEGGADAFALDVTVAGGAVVELAGGGDEAVMFAGTTGTLQLDDAVTFTGLISGLTGSDTLDLTDVSFGANTTATYVGNTAGGTLTISDGTCTASLNLVGNYLSSTWDLSSDGHGGTAVVDPVAFQNWQTLNVGAGGLLSGIDVTPDGTMVARTDTYGAYIWNGDEWQQLITATSMPAGFVTPNSNIEGVYEIQIAPSDTHIIYMMYEGYVFQSANQGATWAETAFAPVTENTSDGYRADGQKMGVDPDNPNVVYAGTPFDGLFVTTNGGASWQSVSGVPISQLDSGGDSPGITGILFDPALGVINGNTKTIFAESYGNGVYESTNAGASWSAIGGPTNVVYAAVASTGVYFATDGTTLWSYQNHTWTQLLTDSHWGIETVAVNPSNPNEIVVLAEAGRVQVSYNDGQTWSGYDANYSLSASDIPWLGNTGSYMTIAGAVFNPLNPNELITSAGVGVWTTTMPQNFTVNTPVVWSSQSIGIEQLVANEIVVPPGGSPILASWDRPFFYISNETAYPSSYSPNTGNALTEGWSVDYASSNPSFLVGIADNWGTEQSGYSTNGGQTWNSFASFIPGAGTSFIGGTIAASSPTNIIWAPADGNEPYYTLNGGQTWNPITLPGVSSWSGFDYEYYFDARTVTADRVLPNTFYLYDAGYGVYESTNGGVTWARVYNGQIAPFSNYNAELQSVPGEAGNLFFTGGPQSGYPAEPFMFSSNGGASWTAVANVTEVNCFGFGAPAPGQSYPSIYIAGWVNNVYGIWQSINEGQSWTQIGTYPTGDLNEIKTISGDSNLYGQVYVGFAGSGYAYLPAAPLVTVVAASPLSGVEVPGNTITLTLTMSEVVTVTGTPTLTLNDGGTATYTSGSGTNALTFSYTVSANDQTVSALAITQANEPNGATITDDSGNAANLVGAATTFIGLQIDPPTPILTAIAESPASGDLGAGKTVTFSLTLSELVLVAGGTPTLTLNDGGIATYVSGSGTHTLTFSYTVSFGQNAAALAATAVNLNSATIADGAGNAANLSLSGLTQIGPQIDTTTPMVSSVVASGTGISSGNGDLNAGKTVTFTLSLSEAVTVAGGTPTLSLNDGGSAAYMGGSGTNALSFSYTVGVGQNTPDLTVTAVNLNSATISDGSGNAANLNGAVTNPSGTLQIDTSTPTISALTESPASGDLGIGKTVTFTLSLSEAVTVAGGTPTLSLNDGGTAIYVSGSGTSTLTFSYTAAAGQTTSSLAATAVSLNSATIADGAGNTANLSLNGLTQHGPQIDTSTPTISGLTESPSSGDLGIGKTVTFTLSLSEAVTVAGGTPTLSLNDGGTAIYVSGSGTSTLTFSYTAAAGQTTSSLAATAVSLNSATIADGAGNTANLSLNGLTQHGPQIDTSTPTISALTESPASGDLGIGKTVTFTLSLSEAVTIAGGTPTLALNDGGTATYVSGAGTNTLTFSYTANAGQSTSSLAAIAVNLNSATIADGAGNVANLSLSGVSQSGPRIDTTAPSITSISESPSSGDLNAGKVVTITLNMSEVVAVNTTGGTPTLTLNDGGTATYVGGSGTNALMFSYTVQAGQNTPDLMETAVNLNGATIIDGAGYAANLSLAGLPQGSPQIDTTTPSVISLAESPSSGDFGVGQTVTFTLTMSETVNVTGIPKLELNDGGVATYVSGSGTNSLTFTYTVATGQNIANLAATTLDLNSATIADGAGNATTSQSLSGSTQTGPQIQTGPQVDIQTTQIDEIYQAVLQRAPTNAEVTAALALGSTFGSAGIVASLVDSSEAIANVYPILQMFNLAFGHFPSAATLASMVEAGLTVPELVTAIVASPTFAITYNGGKLLNPNSPVTEGIVQALYAQALGHAPSQATLNGWLTSGLTVAQSFQAMVTSQSYLATTQLAIEQCLITAANNSAGLSNSTITAGAPDVTSTQIGTISEAVLQRAPTASEVTASLALDSTTGNAGMIAALVNAPEAVANVYPILQMFNLAFGYFPGAATMASMVESGLTLAQLAEAVVGSQTFANVYNGGALINANSPVTAGIVEALYSQALGHAPSQATLNGWLTSGLTVAQAFQDMVTSDSYFATTQLAIEQYLTAAAFNQAGLTTINGTDATGGLTLGALATPLTTAGLTVLGGSGTLTVVASGAGDTITELSASRAGSAITANGAGDTINAANGANTITANGAGDHINLGVVSTTGTSITAPQTIHTAGAGDIITFATTAADSTAVTWGTGATSTVDGGNSMTGIGADSTVNFGNNTGGGSETVVLTGDLAGATTSGGISTSGIAMTTLGNVQNGAGDLVVFNNATMEVLAGTSAINVSPATSLAQALDMAAASAAAESGGMIGAHTGVIDWFQYGGNTYVLEAINSSAIATNHSALAVTDEVIKIVGVVNLNGEGLTAHSLTL